MSDITTGSVTANGLDFGYLTAGPADGPWRCSCTASRLAAHLAAPHARTRRRRIPPRRPVHARLRPTSVPEDGAFQTGALAADAVALHEALGGGSDAVIVGHDWGAFTTYGAANVAPDRWRKVVAMSVPPMSVMGTAFFDYEQLKRSFYIFVFQTPLAEMALNRAFVEGLWRDWSPSDGRDHTVDVDHVMDRLATPANVEAAIGYYRAMLDPSKLIARYAAEQEAASAVGKLPVLYLHGAEDGCLGADVVEMDAVRAALPPGSRAELVADGCHFLQLDNPADVNTHILSWLR